MACDWTHAKVHIYVHTYVHTFFLSAHEFIAIDKISKSSTQPYVNWGIHIIAM